MVLVTLTIKPQYWYIINYNNRKNTNGFLSIIVDKKATYFYNQLHTISSPYIWHERKGHVGLLRLYKLEKSAWKSKFESKRCPNAFTVDYQKYPNKYYIDYLQKLRRGMR